MPRDLSLYLKDLAFLEFVPLDPGDPRLGAIRDAYEKRNWLEAADLATNLAGEGIFDITPMSYALYGSFREGGISTIELILDVLTAAFGKNFKAIGPRDRHDGYFASRVAWIFQTMHDNILYYQKTGGDEWKTLTDSLTSVRLREIINHTEPLDTVLAAPAWEKVALALAALVGDLRDLAAVLERQELYAKATAAKPTTSDKPVESSNPGNASSANTHNDEPPVDPAAAEIVLSAENAVGIGTSSSGAKRTITLPVSPQFLEFLAKLRAFETLVERGQQMKAAIVAEDIQHVVEHFDPRVYFPDVFSRFSQLLCEHADELEEGLRLQNSFAWKTASQFYQVDLDKFVHGKKK